MNPLLSVVMPTYNGERFVSAALESVCRQYRDGMEMLIVDDGSSDSTLDIVRSFSGKLRLRLVTPRTSGNWVAASNVGLLEAKGEWACFLHQDDIWLPGRIARIWSELKNPDVALILHNAMYIGPNGERLGPWTCPLQNGSVSANKLMERLLVQNFVAAPSPVFRRAVALEMGGLDESLWFSADWDFWLRLGSASPAYFIDEILAGFRIHSTSQTVARGTAPGEWEEQLSVVLRRHLQHWAGTGKRRRSVERMAEASIAVNSVISAASRGQPVPFRALLSKLVALGPLEFVECIKLTRILQRVGARIRLVRTRELTPKRRMRSGYGLVG